MLSRIGVDFDDAQPLENIPAVVYAAAVVVVEPLMVQARSLLSQIEAALVPVDPVVGDWFFNIQGAMRSLGFPAVS